MPHLLCLDITSHPSVTLPPSPTRGEGKYNVSSLIIPAQAFSHGDRDDELWLANLMNGRYVPEADAKSALIYSGSTGLGYLVDHLFLIYRYTNQKDYKSDFIMQIFKILSVFLIIDCFAKELKAEEINWGQSVTAGQTSSANKPKVGNKLPGVSDNLFDASSSKPKMICLGGRWVATSPYGSTDSQNTQWNCVGGVLAPDPRYSNESPQ